MIPFRKACLSLGFLYLLAGSVVKSVYASSDPNQIYLHTSPPSLTGSDDSVLELASVSSDAFTVFSHPEFPNRSVRIKKSNFCDGGVATYTGYIDSGPRHHFFYFFESRSNPDEDDVILWTNGGPGGSSAIGLFLEMGPCVLESANTTKYNPYSWNTNANIFFIDQPIGVGFSYADFGESVSTTEEAAKDIAAFVALFFETFNKFKGRKFHMAGESYGGHYIPIFAAEVYDQNANLVSKGLTPINLKSIILGNGMSEIYNSLTSYYDAACTNASIPPVGSISDCVKAKQALLRCQKLLKTACDDSLDYINCAAAFQFCEAELMRPVERAGRGVYDLTLECTGVYECIPGLSEIDEFLNLPWVRSALGTTSFTSNVSIISFPVGSAFARSYDILHRVDYHVAALLERQVRVLVFAGTYDFICNWVGNERWTRGMVWSGQAGFGEQELKEWEVGGSPAGKMRAYGGLTFASVYGGSHMAPRDKPVETLEMLKRWLAEESL